MKELAKAITRIGITAIVCGSAYMMKAPGVVLILVPVFFFIALGERD